MHTPNYLVDDKVQGFFEWKKEFIAEDIEEFGFEVKRPPGELMRMYGMYRNFQTSDSAVSVRKSKI